MSLVDQLGRPGGGAPMRARDGRIINDRREIQASLNNPQPPPGQGAPNMNPYGGGYTPSGGYGGLARPVGDYASVNWPSGNAARPATATASIPLSAAWSSPLGSQPIESVTPSKFAQPPPAYNRPTSAYQPPPMPPPDTLRQDIAKQIEEKERKAAFDKQMQKMEDERDRLRIERDIQKMRDEAERERLLAAEKERLRMDNERAAQKDLMDRINAEKAKQAYLDSMKQQDRPLRSLDPTLAGPRQPSVFPGSGARYDSAFRPSSPPVPTVQHQIDRQTQPADSYQVRRDRPPSQPQPVFEPEPYQAAPMRNGRPASPEARVQYETTPVRLNEVDVYETRSVLKPKPYPIAPGLTPADATPMERDLYNERDRVQDALNDKRYGLSVFNNDRPPPRDDDGNRDRPTRTKPSKPIRIASPIQQTPLRPSKIRSDFDDFPTSRQRPTVDPKDPPLMRLINGPKPTFANDPSTLPPPPQRAAKPPPQDDDVKIYQPFKNKPKPKPSRSRRNDDDDDRDANRDDDAKDEDPEKILDKYLKDQKYR